MPKIVFEKTKVDREDIRRALKCLEDNGIEKSECPTVLQALGYILTDTELEDLFIEDDYKPRFQLLKDYNTKIYKCDVESHTVYVKMVEHGKWMQVYLYIETEDEDLLFEINHVDIENWKSEYDTEVDLLTHVLDEITLGLTNILKERNEAYERYEECGDKRIISVDNLDL